MAIVFFNECYKANNTCWIIHDECFTTRTIHDAWYMMNVRTHMIHDEWYMMHDTTPMIHDAWYMMNCYSTHTWYMMNCTWWMLQYTRWITLNATTATSPLPLPPYAQEPNVLAALATGTHSHTGHHQTTWPCLFLSSDISSYGQVEDHDAMEGKGDKEMKRWLGTHACM